MDTYLLKTYFKQLHTIYPLSDELKNELIQTTEIIECNKKSILVQQGQKANYVYAIIKGLCRSYYTLDGTDITAAFFNEGDFIFCLDSYYNQQPENSSIETIENCIIGKISFTHLAILFKKYLELNYIVRVLAHRHILDNEKRLMLLRKMKSTEKWSYFTTHYAHLLNRVPLMHIATYLGMNLETLSRVRAAK